MRHRRSILSVCSPLLAASLALALVAPATGHAGSREMSVKRRNNYDQFVREREAKERRERFEADREAREERMANQKEERAQRRRNGGKTDDELELESFGSRTLGAACIYGPGGEVIHRPPGARCRGESAAPPLVEIEPGAQPAPAAPAPRTRKARPGRRRPEARQSTAPRTNAVLAPGEERRSRRERCVWVNGRIAFQPEGVDCYAD